MAYTHLFGFYSSVQIILVYNTWVSLSLILPELKGSLPDPSVISQILSQFIRPVMRSINEPISKALTETEVEKTIREKIEELIPLLQDNDTAFENILLEDRDETTIIEFFPKTDLQNKSNVEDDLFKSHLKKYKKMREKIHKALIKESVSDKTKNLVIKTLDDMLKSLVGSQCKWKRNLRAEKPSNPSFIASKWNDSLQKIKDVLLGFITNKSGNTRRNDEVLKFFDAIQILFRSVTEDVDVISKKYKILCDFVPKDRNSAEVNSSSLRNNWDQTDLEEDRCQNVIVCSNELKEFLRIFYNSLNETTVSVLNNYAEMYTRDVILDTEDEKDVVSLLNKIIDSLDDVIIKAFITETKKLKLHNGKSKHANIDVMSNYVRITVENVKDAAKNLIQSELPVLKQKIFSIISDDLNVNLDVDLGNLEREFTRKICTTFRFCNGRYKGRRQGSINPNKNNLYVQVQLTLDDDLTDINSYRKFLTKITPMNTPTINRFSYANTTVTRTTLI